MANQELQFEATHEQLGANDERWEKQVQGLLADLKAQSVQAKRAAGESEPGKKGIDASQIIIALGSAGAITAAVEVFKAWLGRDKKRSIRIKNTKDELTITGDNISEQLLSKALDVGAGRQGSGG
jgi:hypothetical protein